MAYRKASEETPVVALGSEDFWAAVQNGGDVRISVGDILVWLRTVLQIEDVNELQAALDAIGATAHEELQAALGSLGGSVSESLETLQADVNTRATKSELTTALGGLDGSVKTKLDTLTADVAAKDTAVRTDFKAADDKVRADIKLVTDTLATKAQLGTAAARNAGNAAGQLPVLGADGKLDASTIPAVAITDTFPVATQAAMLASGAERGDIAIRTDLNRCYILQTEPATTLANWKELLTPTDAVLSVAGLTGAITAAGLKAALGIAIGDVSGLQAALNSIRTDFAAADTAVRGEFAAADAAIRTDFAAADAALRSDLNGVISGKFDKTGGTVTGDVTATGMVRSDRLTYTRATTLANGTDLNTIKVAGFYDGSALVNAPDATNWWYIEVQRHTSDNGHVHQRATRVSGTPEVYVRNQSGAVWGAWYRVWTGVSFNPDSKASLNASVSFSALTVSARPTWAGLTPWDNGNFNPATKANVAGQAFTGAISAYNGIVAQNPGTGSSKLSEGSDTRSGYVEFRHADGTRHGFIGWGTAGVVTINAENGYRYDFNVAPTIAGATIHTSANFNPATKADLAGATFTGDIATHRGNDTGVIYLGSAKSHYLYWNGSSYQMPNGELYVNGTLVARDATTPRFTGMMLGTGLGTVYADAGANNVVLRSGANTTASPYRYAAMQPDLFRTYTADIYADGNLRTNNRVIVGEGQTSSMIEMRDTDEGNRFVHNNSGTIGFLDSSAGWAFRVWDSGAVWTKQFGDLNNRIEDRAGAWARQESVNRANERVAKAGDTMSGDLTVSKTYPTFRMVYPGVRDVVWQVREDANTYLWDNSLGNWQMRVDTGGNIVARGSLYTGNGSANMATNGDVWGAVWGSRWLSSVVGEKLNRAGDTMTGNLEISKTDPAINFRAGGNFERIVLASDSSIQFQDGNFASNFTISQGGAVWTRQLGDLNNRIEDRARAYADDRASYRVAKGGDTMTGELRVQMGDPRVKLDRNGVGGFSLLVHSDNRLYIQKEQGWAYQNNCFSIGAGGDIWTNQLGDLATWVRNVVNNKSARLAYAGDLDNNWNINGGNGDPYSEPYGGGVITTRFTTSNNFIVSSWQGARWRYLQMSDAWGNWYTCGYA